MCCGLMKLPGLEDCYSVTVLQKEVAHLLERPYEKCPSDERSTRLRNVKSALELPILSGGIQQLPNGRIDDNLNHKLPLQ
jgi:hypothetical protein